MNERPHAAIYVRVSSTGQAEDGTSLQTQEEQCRAYAAEHGYDVAGVYRETHTGVELWERPRLTELRDLSRRHGLDVIVAYAIDRLSRDPVHLGVILSEAEHAGVRVAFVTEPLDDSPEGQLIRFVRGYAAKVEHAKFKERSWRGKMARVQAGRPLHGCKVLYGYRWADEAKSALATDEAAAAVVRRIYREAAAGATLLSIASRLGTGGTPSPTGKPYWNRTTVHGILKNPAYAGEPIALRRRTKRTAESTVPIALPPGVVPPLVSRGQFDDVQGILRLNQLQASRNNHEPQEAVFRGGFARCGHCGRALTVLRTAHSGPFYRCQGGKLSPTPCTNHGMMVHTLDQAAWSSIEQALTRPERVAEHLERLATDDPTAGDLAAVARAVADVERRQHNLIDTLASQDAPAIRAALAGKLAELETQRTQLLAEQDTILARREGWQRAHQQLAAIQVWCQALAEKLPTLDYEQKRSVLKTLRFTVRVYRQGEPQRLRLEASIPLEQPVASSTS